MLVYHRINSKENNWVRGEQIGRQLQHWTEITLWFNMAMKILLTLKRKIFV